MGMRVLGAAVAALLAAPGSAAAAGDPIMPLDQVRSGMQCTGHSVVRGTEVTSFDVEVLDVVGGDPGARILVRVSGPAVDATGVGAGFSGSPIYCPDGEGVPRNIGAISETIGDYGGKTVLATPIEAILAADPAPAAPRNARRLASPLLVRGVDRPVLGALQRALRRSGRTVLAAPPAARGAQAPPPGNPFRPGSAVGVGYSSGDVGIGAIGTVAYVDGANVWTFAHEFDGVGRRALLLQAAYVTAVINNPVQLPESGGTYKLAGPTTDVGTATNDTLSAVTGTVGGLPRVIGVHVFAEDETRDRRRTTNVRVADETSVGTPTGTSPLGFVGPVAIAQAGTSLFDSTPTRLMGTMCLQIRVRERAAPMRVCNRYVSDGTGAVPTGGNVVSIKAAADATQALALLDAYKPDDLHVEEVTARLRMRTGQHQAFMRDLRLPRRARPGQRIRARLTVQLVRGPTRRISFTMRAPRVVGERLVTLRGTEADSADEDLFGGLTIDLSEPEEDADTTGPTTLDELAEAVGSLHVDDGIRFGGREVYRDEDLRIGGRASALIRISRR